jgi:hypothetical protein
MSRSFSAPLAALTGLMLFGAAPSEASEVSEVTIQSPQPAAPMRVAHNIEYAPSAVSEVTISPATPAEPAQVVAASAPLPASATVSEVTIQPPLDVGPQRASRRSGFSLSTGDQRPPNR